MDQNTLTRRRESANCRTHSAEHPVFVSDDFLCKAVISFSLPVPADNGIIILLRRSKVTEIRHFKPISDRIHNKRPRRKAHIGNPHGDRGKPLFHRNTFKRNFVSSKRISSVTVQNRGKIKFHIFSLLFRLLTVSIKQKTKEVKRS